MDQETREAFKNLAGDLKHHIDERHKEVLHRFDQQDERLKRLDISVAYLEKEERRRSVSANDAGYPMAAHPG